MDLVKRGTISLQEYDRTIPLIIDMIKTANLNTCKEVVNLIKKILKDKHTSPKSKLFALKIFHSCMLVCNTEFLNYSQKKIMSRLAGLASHKKQIVDDSRGDDIFGKESLASEDNKQASREFLFYLLNYIQI